MMIQKNSSNSSLLFERFYGVDREIDKPMFYSYDTYVRINERNDRDTR